MVERRVLASWGGVKLIMEVDETDFILDSDGDESPLILGFEIERSRDINVEVLVEVRGVAKISRNSRSDRGLTVNLPTPQRAYMDDLTVSVGRI